MKKLILLLLFIPLISFGQIISYNDVMSISSVNMFKKVVIENGFQKYNESLTVEMNEQMKSTYAYGLKNFKGKAAVITGASGGMGLEISKKLSQNNISVLMLDLKSPSKEFLDNNRKCVFKKVDVTNFKKLKLYIDNFYKKHKRLDYLVNTTGVLWFDKDVSAVNINSNVWDKVFEINLKSMMYLSKIIVPKMIKNKFDSRKSYYSIRG